MYICVDIVGIKCTLFSISVYLHLLYSFTLLPTTLIATDVNTNEMYTFKCTYFRCHWHMHNLFSHDLASHCFLFISNAGIWAFRSVGIIACFLIRRHLIKNVKRISGYLLNICCLNIWNYKILGTTH